MQRGRCAHSLGKIDRKTSQFKEYTLKMPVQDRHGLEAFSQLFLRSHGALNQFRLDLELAGDVLHDIDATRDLALIAKWYRRIGLLRAANR